MTPASDNHAPTPQSESIEQEQIHHHLSSQELPNSQLFDVEKLQETDQPNMWSNSHDQSISSHPESLTQGLEKIRQEFKALCKIEDLLEQNYQLIHYANKSDLGADEYRQLFQQFKSDHLSQEHQNNLLNDLHKEFAAIARVSDPIERNYRLMHQAKASELATEEYRQLFEDYERRSAEGLSAIVNNGLHRLASLAGFLGQFTIIVGLILFIAEADNRKRDSHTQAWETITNAKTFTESAGRIQAIQTLKRGCSYRDIVVQDSELITDPIADPITLFQPQGWRAINWRSMPIVGGFFPDCISLRGLDVANAHLPKVDMSWAELNNARMQNIGLWSANMTGASLQGAQLQGAKLRNVELRGTNLQGTQLQNADLSGANLGCVVDDGDGIRLCTNLDRANLRGANLRGDRPTDTTLFSYQTTFEEAIFTNVLYDDQTKIDICLIDEPNDDLNDATPECAEESYLSLGAFLQSREASVENFLCPTASGNRCDDRLLSIRNNLRLAFKDARYISPYANFNEATLQLTDLGDANLYHAYLNDADLRGVRLQDAELSQAQLKNANLSCGESRSEDPTQTSAICSNLYGATLEQANLESANLSRATLRNAVFVNANLVGANLTEVDLTNATLSTANVSGANFSGATGWTVEQLQSANNWEEAIYDAEQRSQLGLAN